MKPNPNNPREFCKKGKANLHDYRVVRTTEDSQIEQCCLCGQTTEYKVSLGRVDSPTYLKEHRRDFLQNSPNSPTYKQFQEVYGDQDSPNRRGA